jgi:predicted component of type VI protein secretion system
MSEDLLLRVRVSLKGRPISSYTFQQDVITIGRDPEADVYLDNAGISREHARIERLENGQFCLKDLGSANGTFLNDEPVESAMIYSSDVVRIGKFSLWLGLEHDRRLHEQPPEVRRAYSEFAPETMMLSAEELDRLMKASRDPASPAPRGSARRPSTPAPGGSRAAPATAAPALATPVATAAPAVAEPAPLEKRRRARNLVSIGLVVILATSLGAGFAWLFLR